MVGKSWVTATLLGLIDGATGISLIGLAWQQRCGIALAYVRLGVKPLKPPRDIKCSVSFGEKLHE